MALDSLFERLNIERNKLKCYLNFIEVLFDF